MFIGLPDFGRPESFGVAEGYAAYEQPGVLSVVPGSLTAVPLQVDQYLQEREGEIAQFTLVTAGFTLDAAMDTTTRDGGPPMLARPAPLSRGLVRLVAPADLGVPAAALAPQPFDAAAGIVLPTLVRLDGVSGELLIGALHAGLLTLGAVALVTVNGLAARCPGTLTVDSGTLLAALGPAPVTPGSLEERALNGLPGLTVTGGPDDADLQVAAVLDRIVTRLAEPDFADENDGGWRFTAGGDGPATVTWDLSEPIVAMRLLRLACDPVIGAGGDAAVGRHTVPPLTSGREQLVVHSTLPTMPAGVVAATVQLTAPPAPPARPFEAEATANLMPPAPAPAVLRLAPGEALVYDVEGAAVMETDRGPRGTAGAVRRVSGDSTPVVTPADLGLRIIPVHATGDLLDLLDLAGVSVTARATRPTRDPAVFVSRAVLTASAPSAWLAVPRDAFTVTLAAEATSRGPRSRTVMQSLPDAAVWLDPFSFTDPPWDEQDEPDQPPLLVVEAAGLRAAGTKGGADWHFLPLTAGPVRDSNGSPQLNLLEIPGTAMLMVTTALEVSDTAQAALRKACVAAGAAAGVRLVPAPFEVEGAAQLMIQRDGTPAEIGTAVSSATVTQDAAFSVTLTGADLSVVHRSLAGETGLLTVQYLLRVSATGPLPRALAGGADPVPVITDASTWRA